MRRRDFLASLAAAGLASGVANLGGCSGSAKPPRPPLPPGELLGASLELGHRLREPKLPPPSETRRVQVAIVGAGIGGLS
ncbi:twin-arginine translocation signal domain-containing protein, partial [Propionivibrio sp.]|uniref:twin-arginine translocation signal domain-containing protein n=1 Tax=Propionivibrio sp. TaxID=2212460 RepID=UPI0025EFC180